MMQRTLAILERRVAVPTVSRARNLDLVASVRDRMASGGVEARLVAGQDGQCADRPAVIGPAEVPGVLLSGHTAVVPTEGQAWTSDPFRLTRRGDRLIARGAGRSACRGTIGTAPDDDDDRR